MKKTPKKLPLIKETVLNIQTVIGGNFVVPQNGYSECETCNPR